MMKTRKPDRFQEFTDECWINFGLIWHISAFFGEYLRTAWKKHRKSLIVILNQYLRALWEGCSFTCSFVLARQFWCLDHASAMDRLLDNPTVPLSRSLVPALPDAWFRLVPPAWRVVRRVVLSDSAPSVVRFSSLPGCRILSDWSGWLVLSDSLPGSGSPRSQLPGSAHAVPVSARYGSGGSSRGPHWHLSSWAATATGADGLHLARLLGDGDGGGGSGGGTWRLPCGPWTAPGTPACLPGRRSRSQSRLVPRRRRRRRHLSCRRPWPTRRTSFDRRSIAGRCRAAGRRPRSLRTAYRHRRRPGRTRRPTAVPGRPLKWIGWGSVCVWRRCWGILGFSEASWERTGLQGGPAGWPGPGPHGRAATRPAGSFLSAPRRVPTAGANLTRRQLRAHTAGAAWEIGPGSPALFRLAASRARGVVRGGCVGSASDPCSLRRCYRRPRHWGVCCDTELRSVCVCDGLVSCGGPPVARPDCAVSGQVSDSSVR